MTRRRGLMGWLAPGLLAAGGAGAWAIRGDAPLGSLRFWERPGQGGAALEALGLYGEVPDFALLDRSGRPVARADLPGQTPTLRVMGVWYESRDVGRTASAQGSPDGHGTEESPARKAETASPRVHTAAADETKGGVRHAGLT